MNRLLPDFVHVGSENNWPPLNLNGNDGFWGLNDDQFVVGSIKSSRALFCDELQAVLDSGSVSQSQSEPCYSIQKTLSCPPVGEVAGISRKRNAESFKGGAGDLKMEKKKMKVYEEEESKFSKKNSNSNSNSKSTTTAADSCRKYPSSSKSDSYSKGGDAPKTDYIHVRARRGQATDSHSLAERVRREKISERMKYLQDLVPGCNKITGKAAMLDEIINYLQSLQRQIELLSMKLAAVSHHDMESNLPKEIYQPILPSSEVNDSGVHFHIHPVVQTPGGINVNTSDTFTDSQIQQFSWWNDVLPQSFTGEGFMGAGNVKLELP